MTNVTGFAKQFAFQSFEVLEGGNVEEVAYTEDGLHVNSDFLDGLNKRSTQLLRLWLGWKKKAVVRRR